jgi:hypothetical protein
METVTVHERVCRIHPELTSDDVLTAWKHIVCSFTRTWTDGRECVAVGVDSKGRLIEVVAVRIADGSFLIFHAMTPPTKKGTQRGRVAVMKKKEIIKSENGQAFTDEMLDRMAERHLSGDWSKAKIGKVVVGRPSISDEEVKTVVFRLPVSTIAAIDKYAAEKGETRSQFLRNAVDSALPTTV